MDFKLLVLDVDGTLTDGKIYISDCGEIMKAFNIKDGYMLSRLRDYGIEPVIITGRTSEIVKRRCEELDIKILYQGVEDKVSCLKDICAKMHITSNQCAYIGDDLNDLDCMELCGHKAAPADAIKVVKDKVDYICTARGGEGAVREYCDYLIDKFIK